MLGLQTIDGSFVNGLEVIQGLDLLAVHFHHNVLRLQARGGGVSGLTEAEDEHACVTLERGLGSVELIEGLCRQVPSRTAALGSFHSALLAKRYANAAALPTPQDK